MSTKQKCVFLDRDGVLNEELGDYITKIDDLIIPEGVPGALKALKAAGYLLIVITNQAGIAKGLYGPELVYAIHEKIQEAADHVIDDLYFCPYHPEFSGKSLSRKPDSLLIEKAIAKYNIDASQSWMVGDRGRDILAGKKVALHTIQILSEHETLVGDHGVANLAEAATIILKQAS